MINVIIPTYNKPVPEICSDADFLFCQLLFENCLKQSSDEGLDKEKL